MEGERCGGSPRQNAGPLAPSASLTVRRLLDQPKGLHVSHPPEIPRTSWTHLDAAKMARLARDLRGEDAASAKIRRMRNRALTFFPKSSNDSKLLGAKRQSKDDMDLLFRNCDPGLSDAAEH